MKTSEQVAALVADLKAVLAKHDASIVWTCGEGSDTHGIYDSHLILQIGRDEVFSCDDDYINHRSFE